MIRFCRVWVVKRSPNLAKRNPLGIAFKHFKRLEFARIQPESNRKDDQKRQITLVSSLKLCERPHSFGILLMPYIIFAYCLVHGAVVFPFALVLQWDELFYCRTKKAVLLCKGSLVDAK